MIKVCPSSPDARWRLGCPVSIAMPPLLASWASQHLSSCPDNTGGGELRGGQRLYGIERLAHYMMSPRPHPEQKFSLSGHDALELIDDQNKIRGIGGDGTLLIACPQWHDGW